MTSPVSEAIPRRRMTRTRWWLAGMAALLFLILLAAWLERRTIANSYVDALMAEKGVPARYTIVDLGPGGQRMENVVIGDPARPDLTADWVETVTRLGWNGPNVVAIRAGAVRMRGRIVDGRVSLGALDRLLPKGDGGPFSLPDIALSVADGRMRLDTPVGPVGMKLTGSGNLRSGFDGTLAAVAPRLASDDCAVAGASGYWRITTLAGAPRLRGPTRGVQVVCGDMIVRGILAEVDARPGAQLDRADGTARIAVGEVRSPTLWLKQLGGTVAQRGTFKDAKGDLALSSGALAAYGASAVRGRIEGAYRIGPTTGFDGVARLERASLPERLRTRLAALAATGAGTPVAPLLEQLGPALALAGRDAAVRADVGLASDDTGVHLSIATLESRSASGATVALAGGEGVSLDGGGVRIDGTLSLAGGGLPQGRVALSQAAPGAPMTGTATFAPYRADGAELALTPVRFRATPGGNTSFSTLATLSGPLGDGRVEQARIALNGGWDGRGRLVLNPRCEAGGFRSLSIAGLRLNPARFALCPHGRALLTIDGGRIGGGARIAAPRLTGTLGGSPLSLAAHGSELRFGDGGLRVDGLTARLGAGAAPSELAISSLIGTIAGGGIAGKYTGAGGRIGAVPLVMSEAAGNWRLKSGVLTLDGGLTLADANSAAPRMNPLPVRDIAFRLANGRIAASGQVRGPDGVVRVADVTIAHDLSSGTGEAKLAVPGITFSERLRPEQLTPTTFGIISAVSGSVHGDGLIRWSPAGVTSTGEFTADGIDLAAAFGPVTGLKTTIRFTDLLALESAPGQVATVATLNPGVPVTDGVFRYQTLSGSRVRVEGARWPLAGGELILEPTLLDFSRPVKRYMTFRIVGLDARTFLQTFEYDNLDATGTFDGELPIVFDADGGELVNGRLVARDGGSLAYRGEVSKENLGTWGNLAFGALRSLRFRALELTLDGPLAGNIVTRARFSGVAQGEGTTSNFLIRRLAKLPFVFNVRIEAPFRSLIGSVRSFYDPSILIEENLPALIREQERIENENKRNGSQQPIQPPESETKR